ncbi:MAG: putative metal-binding motif-containing protein [Deltaproteobacteria bacterium]|nr:putative metal-binding motif-containing protein [Myxococcales bacterium]MDP3220293.1 putative metal-binding motif-containing protein [Deltaproteobacteria bacterium]
MNSTKARWAVSAGLVVAGAMALGGCVVRARAQPVYVRPAGRVVVQTQPVYQQPVYQAQPVYQQPVYQQPVCGQCIQGAGEACNGCDDNCNGVVDEGCR